ncbi:UNVERIFIED_CONTAM: hypothetical protein HDU68_012423 [Siphonaria sp. JEL0065]|nr:hypothetical protein HDU68_012423 [Siphonaria sp. JEL0065]
MTFNTFERKFSAINSDGTRIGFVKTDSVGSRQIHLVRRDESAELRQNQRSRIVTTVDNIVNFGWTQHSDVLWYSQATTASSQECKIYTLNVASQAITCLTPENNTVNSVAGTSKDHPDHILILSNKRTSNSTLDLYLTNIHNAQERIVLDNDANFTTIIPDPFFSSVAALRNCPVSSNTEIFHIRLSDILTASPQQIITKQTSTKTEKVTKILAFGIKEITTRKIVSTSFVSSTAKAASAGNIVISVSQRDRLFGTSSHGGKIEIVGFDELAESLYISFVNGIEGTKKFVCCDLNGIERRVLERACVVDASTHKVLNCSDNHYTILSVLAGQNQQYNVQSSSASGFSWIVSVGNEVYLYNRATQNAFFLFKSWDTAFVPAAAAATVKLLRPSEKLSLVAPTLPIERQEIMSS